MIQVGSKVRLNYTDDVLYQSGIVTEIKMVKMERKAAEEATIKWDAAVDTNGQRYDEAIGTEWVEYLEEVK
jgi:hypothetical protein